MFTWDTVHDVDCSEVNKSAADAIMTSVRDTIATYPFLLQHRDQQVRILTGIEEGTFSWIATNYLSGNFGVRSLVKLDDDLLALRSLSPVIWIWGCFSGCKFYGNYYLRNSLEFLEIFVADR